MNFKRVVVTGLGTLTPIGNNVPQFWDALLRGVSGASLITRFDSSNFKCHIAAELKGFDPDEHFDKKEIRKLDPFTQYGLVAADEAIRDAGLDLEHLNKDRIGVIFGTGNHRHLCWSNIHQIRIPRPQLLHLRGLRLIGHGHQRCLHAHPHGQGRHLRHRW